MDWIEPLTPYLRLGGLIILVIGLVITMVSGRKRRVERKKEREQNRDN